MKNCMHDSFAIFPFPARGSFLPLLRPRTGSQLPQWSLWKTVSRKKAIKAERKGEKKRRRCSRAGEIVCVLSFSFSLFPSLPLSLLKSTVDLRVSCSVLIIEPDDLL